MKTDELGSFKVTDMRDMRFGEILVVKESGAEVYNTTGLNDCPENLWDKMDLDKIKQETGAITVQKNGPKFWMMDSQILSLGEKASFDGLEARLAATLDPTELLKQGAEPYKVFTPKKTQYMVYAKDKPVFELVDSDSRSYVLQARAEQFPIESLAKLGPRLKQLPKGWLYRTRILNKELVLDLGPDKMIYAVGDEFHQYYTRI